MVFLNQSGKKRNKFIYGSIKRFMTITLKHDIFISSSSCRPEKKGHHYHRVINIIRVDRMSKENNLTGLITIIDVILMNIFVT